MELDYHRLTTGIISAVAVAGSIYSFARGRLTIGIEGRPADEYAVIVGTKARVLAALFATAGIVLLFHTTSGICMMIGLTVIALLISH